MNRESQQNGFYLVFLAILLFAIISLIVAVLGLGLLSRAKSNLLNYSNLAALAALEGMVNEPASGYDTKVSTGLSRAIATLNANRLPGTQAPITQIDVYPNPPAQSGSLAFGVYYSRDPDSTGPLDPCSGTYPCFVPNAVPGPVNAAQLSINTSPSDPIYFEIGKFLGIDSFNISSVATAAMVPRCTAYLSDLSGSTSQQTHTGYQFINKHKHACIDPFNNCDPTCTSENSFYRGALSNCDPKYVIDTDPSTGAPQSLGLPAFLESSLSSNPCAQVNGTSWWFQNEPDSISWCNLLPNRRDTMGNEGIMHYKDDYDIVTPNLPSSGPMPSVRIDKYYEPPLYTGFQPGSNFLQAFNAGLRLMQNSQSGSDLGMVLMFAGNIRDQVPPIGLTGDLNHLIQLTNMNNGGRKIFDPSLPGNIPDPANPEVHPNYIDHGWFPVSANFPGGSGTNIIQALYNAAVSLNQNCDPLASKAVVLASDGVVTCNAQGDPNISICNSAYSTNQIAEKQLLRAAISGSIPAMNQLMRNWEIAVTTLHDGPGVRPNIFNLRNPLMNCGSWNSTTGFSQNTNNPSCYLDYEQARKLSYSAISSSSPHGHMLAMGSWDPNGTLVPDGAAFASFNSSAPNWIYGRAAGLMAQLAIDTGGYYCPLLEPMGTPGTYNNFYVNFYQDRGPAGSQAACDSDLNSNPNDDCDKAHYACSPCVLMDRYRKPCSASAVDPCDPKPISQNVLSAAPTLVSKGEQAALCTRKAVGANPFTLVTLNP